MKILVVTEQYVVDDINGKYYSNNIVDIHINRLRMLGDITLCAQISHEQTSKREIDLPDVRLFSITKENTVYRRYINRRANRKTIESEVRNADFVVLFVPSSVADMAAEYVKKYNKKYLTIVIACPWDALWNYSLKGKMIAPIRYLETKRTVWNASYSIYVTSAFLQDRYPCLGKTIGISDVALPTIDESEVLPLRMERIKRTFDGGAINLVTAAAVNVRYKRQEDVIRAIAELKDEYDLHYYLIGGGDQTYLKNIAQTTGIENRIHFLGQVRHEDIFQILDRMDICMQPSVQEGLPRAVVEAMSRGLPALGAKTGGIPELLDPKCVCRRKSVSDIVSHLRWLLNEDEMMRQSERNYHEAKKYESEVLEKRRKVFLEQVKQELKASNLYVADK